MMHWRSNVSTRGGEGVGGGSLIIKERKLVIEGLQLEVRRDIIKVLLEYVKWA